MFDVAAPSVLEFDGTDLAIEADLLVSKELAGVLGNAGLTGAEIGAASINGEAVPEPATMLGVMTAGALFAASKRRRSA